MALHASVQPCPPCVPWSCMSRESRRQGIARPGCPVTGAENVHSSALTALSTCESKKVEGGVHRSSSQTISCTVECQIGPDTVRAPLFPAAPLARTPKDGSVCGAVVPAPRGTSGRRREDVAVAIQTTRDGRNEIVRRAARARHEHVPVPERAANAQIAWPHQVTTGRHSHRSAAWTFGRMMSDYDVTLVDDNSADMYVIFHGPKDSKCPPRPACMRQGGGRSGSARAACVGAA